METLKLSLKGIYEQQQHKKLQQQQLPHQQQNLCIKGVPSRYDIFKI